MKDMNVNYCKEFKSQMKTTKAHDGKLWILDLLKSRIVSKNMAEDGHVDILAPRTSMTGQTSKQRTCFLYVCSSA